MPTHFAFIRSWKGPGKHLRLSSQFTNKNPANQLWQYLAHCDLIGPGSEISLPSDQDSEPQFPVSLPWEVEGLKLPSLEASFAEALHRQERDISLLQTLKANEHKESTQYCIEGASTLC